MASNPVIVWFRQDLRLADNSALHEAARTGAPVIPLYILDDGHAHEWRMGGASRVWLHHSLEALDAALSGRLHRAAGDALTLIPALMERTGAKAIYWNRCYEPWRVARDTRLKAALEADNIAVHSFNGSLLWEPWDVLKKDGTPYKVFTPYYRKGCLSAKPPRTPLPAPDKLSFAPPVPEGLTLKELALLPAAPRWDRSMMTGWTPGERGAAAALKDFLADGLKGYRDGRNVPGENHTSRLSPHLHFGEISPHAVWQAVQAYGPAHRLEADTDNFLSELGWREFSYSLLYYVPSLVWDNLNPKFNRFPWREEEGGLLQAWQRGRTGYPIVDAGMRELWQTGYMHNRVRMIVGSFLVKHLLIHWRLGARWFWDTLVDADLANNSASWQWIAGCGADAAPYFRIFNPVTQGEKFDARGAYVRRYVPELKNMPDKYLHKPWTADQGVLDAAGVVLGRTYPHPVVDHAAAREKALKAFEKTK